MLITRLFMNNKPNQIEVEIACPNCQMITEASYDKSEKRPSIFGLCPFCGTRWRWRKCSTVEIIPADRKTYAYAKPDNNIPVSMEKP
jgi:uncharacterized Zn-finger protein